MIDVQNLSKSYGERVAVDGVTFSVAAGEVLGFLGPNGAGKTTTMRVITGYIPATGGTVKIDGHDVFDDPLEVRRRIGYLPETPPLYLEMRVCDYLQFVARLKGVPRGKARAEAGRAAERTGCSGVFERIAGNLSKGYRQRVGLAQALLGDPPVIVLDEPTVGLDPNQIVEVRALIKSLAGSHTVILSTHILQEVTMTCTRVVIISGGRVVASDSIEGITSGQARADLVRVRVARPEGLAARLTGVPGVRGAKREREDREDAWIVEGISGSDIREAIADRVVAGGHGLLELSTLTPNLEDVFRKLTREVGSDLRAGGAGGGSHPLSESSPPPPANATPHATSHPEDSVSPTAKDEPDAT